MLVYVHDSFDTLIITLECMHLSRMVGLLCFACRFLIRYGPRSIIIIFISLYSCNEALISTVCLFFSMCTRLLHNCQGGLYYTGRCGGKFKRLVTSYPPPSIAQTKKYSYANIY